MKKHLSTRLLSWLLVISMLLGNMIPAASAQSAGAQELSFRRVDASILTEQTTDEVPAEEADAVGHADTDIVRVSIVLESQSTLEAGFPAQAIAANADAMAYRSGLEKEQIAVTAKIEAAIGQELDVAWNLTLAANLISANVEYGRIDEIRAVPGVVEVIEENIYYPDVASSETVDPNMSTSDEMIGSAAAYAAGYTGAGRRIAVIDTGIDTNHQSFDGAALEYSLGLLAQEAGVSTDEYIGSLDLLDLEEIKSVLSQLNIAPIMEANGFTAEELYYSTKIAFGFDYADRSLDVTHDNDTSSEHGSHVEGIAAANAYIPNGDGTFTEAMTAVNVRGVAPDAQIISMKVFGQSGGASDSDYLAALEDAILLGADSVNLSLGSGNPGFTNYNGSVIYQEILNSLPESGVVVSISAGNSYYWSNSSVSPDGLLYQGDINFATSGSPGTYTNSLSVASVDNVGYTDNYMMVGETSAFYSQTCYSNVPLETLAGEQEYVYIDGYGTSSQFSKLADVLNGKIAICSRGSNSFYQKANYAVENGAVGVIIYNNAEGTFRMDLTDYKYTAPVVSVSGEVGALLKDNASELLDDSGNLRCYVGKLTVCEGTASVVSDAEYYTMSDFSSWGVPGSLEMKPEITAPGGNIYSVNGADKSGTAYENMSGTSMAAPQVAGMAALLAQRIEENGLTEKTGLSARQLGQSLLMSTAEPILEDQGEGAGYYPILRQGAGLANIGSAVTANSFILMDEDANAGAADGKVKVELGDDPDRTGRYGFGYTLTNFGDSAQTYTLDADLFTQALLSSEDGVLLDTKTAPLAANVTYTVGGETYVAVSGLVCDLDGDGDTDADDAQVILNYRAGLTGEIDPVADVDDDGSVTTYDAYLILSTLTTGRFTLQPGQSVQIRASIELSDSVKAYLDDAYGTGAYVQGYFYVNPVADAEGAITDVSHSIPVLGFYGSWTDPSMYDRQSVTEYLYGSREGTYTGVVETNNLLYRHQGDDTTYYYVGNPYLRDGAYDPTRNAIKSTDTLYAYYLSMIRNAAAVAVVVTDDEGNVIDVGEVTNQVLAAFYYVSGGIWYNTRLSAPYNKLVSRLEVQEGDRINVSLVAIPEYYLPEGSTTFNAQQVEELVESGRLGLGAYLTTPMTVDDTAPEILSMTRDLVTGNINVTAKDNQYVAAVSILNSAASKTLALTGVNQTEAGETVEAVVDMTDVKVGTTCYIMVGDYAGNETLYEVTLGGEPENYTGRFYGFTNVNYRGSGRRWMEFDPEKVWYQNASNNGGMDTVAQMDLNVVAADYVDGYVYMAADDGYLYVARQGEWEAYQKVGYYGDVTTVNDMAYSYSDGKLYAISDDNTIYSIDLFTGEFTKEYTVSILNPYSTKDDHKRLLTLAIDDDGNFYSLNWSNSTAGTYLYHWTEENVQTTENGRAIVDLTPVDNQKSGDTDASATNYQSMTWDHDADKLYWARCTTSTNSSTNQFLELNTETGKSSKVNTTYAGEGTANPKTYGSVLYVQLRGFYIVPGSATVITPSDEAMGIELSETQLTYLKGGTKKIDVLVKPWTLKDQSVTWATSDPSVATVDNGFVICVGAGEAVITATTNAEPHLSASCNVTVNELQEIKLNALVYGSDGLGHWAEISTSAPDQWTDVGTTTYSLQGGAMHNGMIYAHDGSNVYAIDPDSFEATLIPTNLESRYFWSDAATAPESVQRYYNTVAGVCNSGYGLVFFDPDDGSYKTTTMYDFMDDPMAAIAYHHSGVADYNTTFNNCPAQYYFVITESGRLYEIEVLTSTHDINYSTTITLLGSTGLELYDVSAVDGTANASMIYDEASGYLLLASSRTGTKAQLYAIDPTTCFAANFGNVGDGNGAAVSLYQFDRVSDTLTVRLNQTTADIYVNDTLNLTARVLPTTNDQSVTWTSDNTAVATVDNNGVVTAHGAGSAVITAASAAGEASASCTVNVTDVVTLSANMTAQITNEAGVSSWVSFSTSDLNTVTVQAPAETTLGGGGRHNGVIYGTDGSYKSSCYWYKIDPENDFYEIKGTTSVATNYAAYDVTTAPAMEVTVDVDGTPTTITAFDMPVAWTQDMSLIMLSDFSTNTRYRWYMRADFHDVMAVAYVGTTTYTDGETSYPAHQYLALGGDGTIYSFLTFVSGYTEKNGAQYSLARGVLGQVDKTFHSYTRVSMAFVDDGTNLGLVVADSDVDAELYYIDLTSSQPTIGKLGNLSGARTIAALCSDTDMTGKTAEALAAPSYDVSVAEQAVEEVTGSLQSVTGDVRFSRDQVVPQASDAEAADGQVTLTLTENEAVTNGLIRISYDPEVLTFGNLTTLFANHAVNEVEPGVILFDYASAVPAAAGDILAQLTFAYENDYVDTVIQVTTLERNRELALEETVTVTVVREDGEHTYELTEEKEPTCEEAGYRIYTCTKCGDSRTETLEPLGHRYGEWVVTEEAGCDHDGLLTRTCLYCTHTQTEGIPAWCPSEDFSDLDTTKWYHQGVCFALRNGLMEGVDKEEGLFDPDGQLTRAQLVTIMYRLAGRPNVEGLDNPFRDVAADRWYTDAIVWAAGEGIVKGVTKTTFAPDAVVTREQIATILYRYTGAGKVEGNFLTGYADAGEVSAYAADAMNWAVANGLITGMTEWKLAPKGSATRAQMATILMRYCK